MCISMFRSLVAEAEAIGLLEAITWINGLNLKNVVFEVGAKVLFIGGFL